VTAPAPFVWADPGPTRIAQDKALAVLRQAVAARPDDVALKLRLARVLYARDLQAEIVDLLAPVVCAADATPDVCFEFGRAAARLELFAEAIPALERAGPFGAGHLADALADAGRDGEAQALALQTLTRDPNDRRSLTVAAKALLARGDTRALLQLSRDVFTRGGRNGEVFAMLSLSAWAEGAPECAVLLDRRRLFARRSGFGGDDFNRALAEEIQNHAALGHSPTYRATLGDGARIEPLECEGGPLALELLSRLPAEIERYATDRAMLANHPVVALRPERLVLHAWALVLHDSGHEDWHIHPSAWLSGVYYVSVPPFADDKAGHIEFGPSRAVAGRDLSGFPGWSLAPRVGELLLFPSYFAHRTWPTGSSTPRISVAFDVVAAGED
jgi:Putative 2OG-Fe(II) oxygenase